MDSVLGVKGVKGVEGPRALRAEHNLEEVKMCCLGWFPRGVAVNPTVLAKRNHSVSAALAPHYLK